MVERAAGIQAIVVPEDGRWVVYFEVSFWRESSDMPLKTERRRIADYSTEAEAKVAASWMARTADRAMPRPNLGF
jgi:hypothetical protein